MKKIVFVSFVLIVAFLISCDKVTNPIIKKSDKVVGSNFITNTNDAVSDYKKVLLEDYTGQKCPNCPDAAKIIKDLIKKYGDTLVAIAVHQGDNSSFAAPLGKKYPNDFRTDAGQAWGSKSDPNAYAIDQYPLGLINRKSYSTNSPKFNKATWASIVPLAKKDVFVLKLNLKTEYDPSKRALNTYVKGTFKTSYDNPVKLIVVYMQDSIIGKQDVFGIEDEAYEFEHMLRGAINGSWGTDLTTTPSIKDKIIDVSFPSFALPDSVRYEEYAKGVYTKIYDHKVTVVAFAYDATNREVLQVEKVKIK